MKEKTLKGVKYLYILINLTYNKNYVACDLTYNHTRLTLSNMWIYIPLFNDSPKYQKLIGKRLGG